MTTPTVRSTQDEARHLMGPGPEPIVVMAARQTEGRGRTGRSWLEAPRALYSSLAFRPAWPRSSLPRLTLVAGLAVREALMSSLDVEAGLKWPNDLVVAAGKLGGILTESEGDVVVIGCGINLWWPDPPAGVAAAAASDPGDQVGEALARGWVGRVLDVAAGEPSEWGQADYRAACVTLGCNVAWDSGGPGRAVDIDADGGLVVEIASGRVTLTSGEVHTVRLV